MSTHSDHWQRFRSFVEAELATGGPDPQITLLEELCRGETVEERVWLAGCYCASHCVPTAYLIWREFRPREAYATSRVNEWLTGNWKYLPVRPEMRSHRMIPKRAKCLTDFAKFALNYAPARYHDYDSAWRDSIASVTYFGRYMAIKFLEMLNRFGGLKHRLPDLRAKGGWSPRRTLAMLFPENLILGQRDNESMEALRQTEFCALGVWDRLNAENVPVTMFQLQVMLCEYKEAIEGTYYPGASHDEELSYIILSSYGFRPEALRPIYEARRALFPLECLGEIGGWNGPRKERYVEFR